MRFRDWFPFWIPFTWAFPWVPFKSVRHLLLTRLSPEECKARLESRVLPATLGIFPTAFMSPDEEYIWGTVSSQSFTIRLIPKPLSYFPPCMVFQAEARGRVVGTPDGTEIRVAVSMSRFIAIAELVFLTGILSLVPFQAMAGIPLLLLAVAGHVMGVHCMYEGAGRLMDFLKQALNARERRART
jgi:hypothetical protein